MNHCKHGAPTDGPRCNECYWAPREGWEWEDLESDLSAAIERAETAEKERDDLRCEWEADAQRIVELASLLAEARVERDAALLRAHKSSVRYHTVSADLASAAKEEKNARAKKAETALAEARKGCP